MVAVRLTPDIELLAVASPDYLARFGEPGTPTDLSQHACINWRFPGSGKLAGWEFRKKGKAVEYFGEGTVISNHQDIIVPAALQGLGILYAYNDDGIAQALQDGRLRRVLADWSPTVPGLFLYYSSRRYLLPALRAFIDCLLDRDLRSDDPTPTASTGVP
ncbi:HTH-type transcriptional regulator PgrR [compost metagenome]